MIVSSPNPRSASQPASLWPLLLRLLSIDHHRGFVLGTSLLSAWELPSKWVLKICTQFLVGYSWKPESLAISFHFTGSPRGARPNTPTKCANFNGYKKNPNSVDQSFGWHPNLVPKVWGFFANFSSSETS
ncbi:unnamed protein product [Sphagnum balticum]